MTGISKYIDADALKAHIRSRAIRCGSALEAAYVDVEALIDEAEAADVAPVVHEHWIKVQFADSKALINNGNLCLTDGFLCGSCGHSVYENSPYCPHCGAKMDVETP